MNNILIGHAWDIWNIASENAVDVGVARDMFVGNLEGDAPQYSGADIDDWDALKAEWFALSEEERGAIKTEYSSVTQALYKQLSTAFRNGDKEGFNRIIEVYTPPEAANE